MGERERATEKEKEKSNKKKDGKRGHGRKKKVKERVGEREEKWEKEGREREGPSTMGGLCLSVILWKLCASSCREDNFALTYCHTKSSCLRVC